MEFRRAKYLHHYLQGFADAEGCFSVALKKTPTARFGWTLDPVFHVTQRRENRRVLELFQQALRCGRIIEKHGQADCLVYIVDNRRQLAEKVIPFFRRYPLIVKRDDFEKFRQIVEGMQRGDHRSIEGFERLVRIAFQMNMFGKQRRYTIDEVLGGLKRTPQRP